MPMTPRPRCLTVKDVGDETVVRFTERVSLNEQTIHPIGEALLQLADRVGPGTLRLDLGNVDFLTSSTLGKLLTLHKKMRARGGRLRLSSVAHEIYEVFEVTRLHTVLDIHQ